MEIKGVARDVDAGALSAPANTSSFRPSDIPAAAGEIMELQTALQLSIRGGVQFHGESENVA
jgi:hypothetical protein